MNVREMLGKVVGGLWNWLANRGRNPGSDLEKHIASLEEGQRGVKMQLAKAIQQERSLAVRLAQFEQLAEQCTQEAMTFLTQGKEEAARTCLRQKKTHLHNAATLRPELEEQRKTVRLLQDSFQVLEGRLAEARIQVEVAAGRQRRADTKLALSGILEETTRSVESCDERLALPDGTVHREAMADAALASERLQLGDSLKLVSQEEEVDAELAQLKDEVRRTA